MNEWFTQVFCKKCGKTFGKATFGIIWFTQKDYPVCPRCGCDSYYYDLRVTRWVPSVKGPWYKLWPLIASGYYEIMGEPQRGEYNQETGE